MSDSGFDSPESAAMVGFPPKQCRVVASRVNGDNASVLLNTGSREQPYLYGINCRRENGRWFEGGSANGPGWEQTGHDPDVGTLSFWDDAPVDEDMVRVEFEDKPDRCHRRLVAEATTSTSPSVKVRNTSNINGAT